MSKLDGCTQYNAHCDVENVLYVGCYSDFTAGKSNVSFC